MIYVNLLSLINFPGSILSVQGEQPLTPLLDSSVLDARLSYIFLFIFIDIFRQKMAEILIHDLHNLAGEAIKTMTHSRSYQIISERQVGPT